MLKSAAAVILCLLFSQVNALITTYAKCVAGYDWTYSSVGQSPCDIAAELASVCVGQFNLDPLGDGYVYSGPTVANANPCRCSSVYYTMLSACAYCQGRKYISWSEYRPNCSTVYVGVYNYEIPVGVKVPAYAYQNVSISGTFNVTLAQGTKSAESSGAPSASASGSP